MPPAWPWLKLKHTGWTDKEYLDEAANHCTAKREQLNANALREHEETVESGRAKGKRKQPLRAEAFCLHHCYTFSKEVRVSCVTFHAPVNEHACEQCAPAIVLARKHRLAATKPKTAKNHVTPGCNALISLIASGALALGV
ncbi:hypothetical protein F444_06989 [Phytophthora nicotianae P1976]|uniref:Uncharacterized protein n=1 Tax=Phytophthora nicotianae P1976 TaxID=1317066 RepID=A0A081AG72_PHYNI|nr:hypothetical protein F444_06989 [Phytophthora nicotianae P1976]